MRLHAMIRKISPEGKLLKLAPLDIVRTQHGTLCVVSNVSDRGEVSLVLPKDSTQKVAWYDPEELDYVGFVH